MNSMRFLLVLVLLTGCTPSLPIPAPDATVDASRDAATDAAVDAALDAAVDAALDAAVDSAARDTGATDSARADVVATDARPACDRTYGPHDACTFVGARCTETVGSGCVATAFCSPGAGAIVLYEDSPACHALLCPSTAPAPGTPTAEPPGVTSGSGTATELTCDYGTADCPVHCRIAANSTSPTMWGWYCTTPVGPTCPASACPATLGDACSWPADLTCSFAGPDSCRFDCSCASGHSACLARNCACPAAQPALSAACPAAPYRALCDYVSATGIDVQCSCGSLRGTNWTCSAPSVSCPSAPPSGTCRAGIDPSSCTYDEAPYCGHCGCDASGHWSCSASSCSMCPSTPPTNHAACTLDQIGQVCDYGSAGSPTSHSHCACIGPSPIWSCA